VSVKKLVGYFFTAGIAAIVDIGGFEVLYSLKAPVAASAVTSFCVASVVNYLLTSRYVFGQAATIRRFGVFFLAAVGGMTVNVSLTLIGSIYFGIAPVIAKIVGVGTAFLLNFWLNVQIVFRAGSVE
jgi:putative flippase GtrA